MKHYLFVIGMMLLVLACGSAQDDEMVLWEYYDAFSMHPDTVTAMARRVQDDSYRKILQGLVYLEQYDLNPNGSAHALDSAAWVFNELIQEDPALYLGYLGLGITLTERARNELNNRQERDSLFRLAVGHLRKADSTSIGHPAVQYYLGRTLFYGSAKDSVNLESIELLENATQNRVGFYKAHERAARFLSYYYGEDQFREKLLKKVPDCKDRIRYHYRLSLDGDSSWAETYEGIASTKGVYAMYEQVNLIEKALRIARDKKSKDTLRLLGKRHLLFAQDLVNFDEVLYAPVITVSDESELSASGKAYYYLWRYVSRDLGDKYYDKLIEVNNGRNFWVSLAVSDEEDTVYSFFANKESNLRFAAVLRLEQSKWYWRDGQIEKALRVIQTVHLPDSLDKSYNGSTLNDRIKVWREYLVRRKKKGEVH